MSNKFENKKWKQNLETGIILEGACRIFRRVNKTKSYKVQQSWV